MVLINQKDRQNQVKEPWESPSELSKRENNTMETETKAWCGREKQLTSRTKMLQMNLAALLDFQNK